MVPDIFWMNGWHVRDVEEQNKKEQITSSGVVPWNESFSRAE